MDVDIIWKLNHWTLFSLIIEIYLHYFPKRLKCAELGKSMCLTFWVSVPKVFWGYTRILLSSEYLYLFCVDLSTKSYRDSCPADTGRKLKVHKTFRRRPGRLLDVLCTLYLRPVSTGWFLVIWNMSVKVYTNFFLSSGGFNFKINYLKDKMRHGMRVHASLNSLASSPLQQGYYFWHRRSKCHVKAVKFKFYSEIFKFKVFLRWND